MPVEVVLERVVRPLAADRLSEQIVASWVRDAEDVRRAGVVWTLPAPPVTVLVELGTPRFRADAVIVPIRWRAASPGWLPQVDAELEIAGFGHERTHVHLVGRYDLPMGTSSSSTDASLVHRLAVALVRQVLVSISEECHD